MSIFRNLISIMEVQQHEQKIIESVSAGHNYLILGQSGTGKSFLLKTLKAKLQILGKKVVLTGTTGVASLNIGGITIHSWSGIADGHFN